MLQISNTPSGCVVNGKTSLDRKMSALVQGDHVTAMALCGAKGSVGKAARGLMSKTGLVRLADRAANNTYGPIAAYIGATLGVSFHISNRASFESIPDRFESMIADAKNAKNGGHRECKKTGALIPGAKLAALMTLKAEFVDMVQQADNIRASREVKEAITQN